jgi:hypothetical protein
MDAAEADSPGDIRHCAGAGPAEEWMHSLGVSMSREMGGMRRRRGGQRDGQRDSGGRAPRHRRGQAGGHEGGGQDREHSEREVTHEMFSRLEMFVNSEEAEMALEPMNSFKRRIAHTVAKEFAIESESRGEDRERHIFLRKTAETRVPDERPEPPGPAPEREEEPDLEAETEAEPEAGPEAPHEPDTERAPPRGRDRESGRAPERGRDRGRSDRGERGDRVGSSRPWDYGSQVFSVKAGPSGARIVLKRDGSVELYREEEKDYVVEERLVTSRQFRVRNGKIVQPGEPGY